MQPLSYRQWLQMKANDTSGQVPTDVTYSKMLLDIAGDDGKLDANAVQENRQFTGNDGETYYTAGAEGDFADPSKGLMTVNDTMYARYNAYRNNPDLVAQYNNGSTTTNNFSSGGGTSTAEDPAMIAERNNLKNEIGGYDIEGIYKGLYDDLDALLKARGKELETEYGSQLEKVAGQYAAAMPEIQSSYAALGAQDSTDLTGAHRKADKGLEETTTTIGKNKEADLAEIGQYGKEQTTKFDTNKGAATRNVARAGQTDDVDALRGFRNDLEGNLDTAKVTRGTLGTDGTARKELSKRTKDNGRFDSAVGALDEVFKSSLSGSVKKAAATAISDAAGLTDEEKQKVDEMYGNVYEEQQAL